MNKIEFNLPLLFCQKVCGKVILDLVDVPVQIADLSGSQLRHAYAYAVDSARLENGYACDGDIWVNAFGVRVCSRDSDNFAIDREVYHQSDPHGERRLDELDIGFNREIALAAQVAFDRAKGFGVKIYTNAIPYRFKRKLDLTEVIPDDLERYQCWVRDNIAHYKGRLMLKRPAPAIYYIQPYSTPGLYRCFDVVSREMDVGRSVGIMTSVGLSDDNFLRPRSSALPQNLNAYLKVQYPLLNYPRLPSDPRQLHIEGRLGINLETYSYLDLEDDYLRRSVIASAHGLLAMYPKSRTSKNGGRDVLYALDEVLADRDAISDDAQLGQLVELMERFPMTYGKGRLHWLGHEKGDIFRLLMGRLFERWYDRDIPSLSPLSSLNPA